MIFHRAAFANRVASAAVVAAVLSLAAAAHAEVNFSIGVGGPVYEQPAPVYVNPPPVYYQPAPPVYYQPAPPVYYQPAPPAYYQPPPPPAYYRPAQPYYPPASAGRPRLSDMQQRALDNCSLLAPREQGRCRATVLSTTR
ncbi:hypothetical protein [Variovorax ginsengisoli]|uniref:Uncharacterized protein n=1 Tax=Variovorax ginsengisoli TaxID=363844 RepID=A0ABT8S414_9BURK|nr:hypothetical protein [Variovorax ginsengisoli]MDN8613814.1 hypothetical protein [Variovorax ginsengisoli]MDO1532984.1 hypothetical protein [Variovorax ginsengisoli]